MPSISDPEGFCPLLPSPGPMAEKFLKDAKLRRMRAQAVPASDSQLTESPNGGLRPGDKGFGVGVYHVDETKRNLIST